MPSDISLYADQIKKTTYKMSDWFKYDLAGQDCKVNVELVKSDGTACAAATALSA
jgi:hypothetical protein